MRTQRLPRRDFLRLSAALGAGAGALSLAACAPTTSTPGGAAKPAASGAPAAPAAPAPASREPVNIRFGTTLSTSVFPLNVGIQQGYFAKRNLQVQLIPYAGFDPLYTAFRAGELDMGTGGLASLVDLHGQGVPVLVVFGNSIMNNDVLVKLESPIQSIADLRGKKIGVFGGASGTTANTFMATCIAYYGFDPRTDANVQYGAAPLLAGMVQRGDVDAFVSLDPITTQQLLTGTVRSVGELGKLINERQGVYPYAGSIQTMEPFAQRHPEAVKGFIEGWLEAVQVLQNNLEEWKNQAATMDIKNESEVRLLMERLQPLWPTKWNQTTVQQQIEALKFVQAYTGTSFLASVPESAFTTAYTPPQAL